MSFLNKSQVLINPKLNEKTLLLLINNYTRKKIAERSKDLIANRKRAFVLVALFSLKLVDEVISP